MIVWRVQGNEIGPNGNGAAHFATKAEADARRRAHMSDEGGTGSIIDPPEKIIIRNRKELAAALDAAMSFGGS